ncbi:hypothetical protein HAX54_020298, partial [Datura stramonium]|nr:hypothetical protein [Datura stramonium]
MAVELCQDPDPTHYCHHEESSKPETRLFISAAIARTPGASSSGLLGNEAWRLQYASALSYEKHDPVLA